MSRRHRYSNITSGMKTTTIPPLSKTITLSPGGFYGFYMMGICKYIKQHYNISDYCFSGASAGAWNSLLLSYNGDIQHIEDEIVNMYSDNKTVSLLTIQQELKRKILERFNTNDFDLSKLYITTVVYNNFSFKTVIYTGFNNLDDAIDCCIASSHIPFITGRLSYRYRGFLSFDGGFCENPYLRNLPSTTLHVTPGLWVNGTNVDEEDFSMLSVVNDTMSNLIEKGYTSAQQNNETLSKTFIKILNDSDDHFI